MSIRDYIYLRADFLKPYRNLKPAFGFDGLGEFVYERTFARVLWDEVPVRNETWFETIARVAEGTLRMATRHMDPIMKTQSYEWRKEFWSMKVRRRWAEKLFDAMFHMRMLPAGRGLWAMGTDIIEKRGLHAALNNCAFVSTKYAAGPHQRPWDPFTFHMNHLMLGVGVGFDTEGADILLHPPKLDKVRELTINDSREGWVEALMYLLGSYMLPHAFTMRFDYSQVRAAGTPLKHFGGVASGPEPLRVMLEAIGDVLQGRINEARANGTEARLGVRGIVDIMNLIGRCVVAGNVRRSAEIAFGQPIDEFLSLKDYDKHPERAAYGWTSNNSVYATVGMDYAPLIPGIIRNGEPGIFWLTNAQDWGLMYDAASYGRDRNASGGNPCLEQTLESYELCNLVELFPTKINDINQFVEMCQVALFYGKVVSLGRVEFGKSQEVIDRNRRIGISMTGIAQFVETKGIGRLKEWCDAGRKAMLEMDPAISKLFQVVTSIKLTSVKPSGTISLLAGVTPGVHYPEFDYYLRRIRVARQSPLISVMEQRGYYIEDDKVDKSSKIIEFPIHLPMRCVKDVSIWEQYELCAFLQQFWADNQVSVTITFRKEEETQLPFLLRYAQYHLKGMSFLPHIPAQKYVQMPYEGITKQQYDILYEDILRRKAVNWVTTDESIVPQPNIKRSVSMESETAAVTTVAYCDSVHCQSP